MISQCVIRFVTLVLGLTLYWAATALGAETNPASVAGPWSKIEASGIVIEFQADTESLARELLPVAVARLGLSAGHTSEQLTALTANRDKVLQVVATQLGMDGPSKEMSGDFDKLANGVQRFLRTLDVYRCLRIWRKEKLKTLLVSGQEIPGFRYDAASDKVEFTGKMEANSSETNTVRQVWPFPICVKADATNTPIDQATRQIEGLADSLGAISRVFSGGADHHELAEVSMSRRLKVNSAFRRWFFEGMANYIAALCLEETRGKVAAGEFLDAYDWAKYKHLKPQVDLLSWRAEEREAESPAPIDGELQHAYYAFATHEVIGLVERHGRSCVPAIFKEIARSETRDEQTILDAIKAVTREDIRENLKAYGASATEHFEGLAVSHFIVGSYEQTDAGKWDVRRAESTIQLMADGKHGVGLHFHYEAVTSPVALRVELIPPAGHKEQVAAYEFTEKKRILAIGWPFTSHTPTGEYRLRVFLGGKLYRESRITVVQEPTAPTESKPGAAGKDE